MLQAEPLVSVGMPVYNEELFVAQSIESLLDQDYRNFELIISDNASTDRTPQIISQLASEDRRITVYLSDKNNGSLANFERVFYLSKGKYFMFASGHDSWQSNFISRAVKVLEKDEDIILGAGQVVLVDKNGTPLKRISGDLDTRNTPPEGRFSQAIRWGAPYHYLAYGLLRSDALRKHKWRRDVVCPDVILVAELSLKGAFLQIQDTTLFARMNHPPASWLDSYYGALKRLGLPSKAILPNMSRYIALMDSAWHSQLDRRTRMSMVAAVWLMGFDELPTNAVGDAIYLLSVFLGMQAANRLDKVLETAAQRLGSIQVSNRFASADS